MLQAHSCTGQGTKGCKLAEHHLLIPIRDSHVLGCAWLHFRLNCLSSPRASSPKGKQFTPRLPPIDDLLASSIILLLKEESTFPSHSENTCTWSPGLGTGMDLCNQVCLLFLLCKLPFLLKSHYLLSANLKITQKRHLCYPYENTPVCHLATHLNTHS